VTVGSRQKPKTTPSPGKIYGERRKDKIPFFYLDHKISYNHTIENMIEEKIRTTTQCADLCWVIRSRGESKVGAHGERALEESVM
jgi:hypothetical protein